MSNANASPEHLRQASNAMLRTDGRTYGRPTHLLEISLVTKRAGKIEEIKVTREEQIRTRVVLAQLQGKQERLTAKLEATELTGFVDRADWLILHRTPDQQHAWRQHWRRLGLADPEPHGERFQKPTSLAMHKPRLESFPRPSSLAVPVPVKPAPKRRRKPAPVISEDRQMEIMLNVLAKKEAA